MTHSLRILLILSFSLLLFAACKNGLPGSSGSIDQGVIIAEKAEVRNSTALVAAPLKELKRGDAVDIMERRTVNQRDFVRVRVEGDKPVEGWLESRLIISKRTVDECNKLLTEWQNIPTQATGKTKDKLKLRLKPGRDSEVITLLPANTPLEIVGRAQTERHVEATAGEPAPAEPRPDNWYEVRLPGEGIIKAGWLYGESVELTPPDVISGLPGAGRRFVAWQPFGKVVDSETGKSESNYVILDKYAYNKDDEIDFDRIYIVAWDGETHAYGSIYIESSIRGRYPLKIEPKDEGFTFTVPLLNKQNELVPAHYQIKRDAKTSKMSVSRIVDVKPKAPATNKPKPPAIKKSGK